MSIIFSVSQKSGFSRKVFLFILSIFVFVLSATALAEIQMPQGETDSVTITGVVGQSPQNEADSAGNIPAGQQSPPAEPDSTATPGVEPTTELASEEVAGETWLSSAEERHHAEDIKRGERFFKGLLPHSNKQPSCVSCHNLYHSDTLNWNPSAMDIAVKYVEKDFASFQEVVVQPTGNKMEQVHQGYQYEEADLRLMKAYLDELAMRGPSPLKPNINSLLVFIFLTLVVVWALLELLIFRKIKYKAVPLLIVLGVFSYQVKIIYEESIRLGRALDYEPEQPIKFSHQVHAEQNKIDCRYCHFTVDDSKSAGIPPADLCLNCHNVVREGTRSGKFEIAKVIEANEKQVPIEWIKIHNLPDHVFFSHAQHVNAGKLDCMECHGDVAKMDVVRQVNDLSMGWCLDCHKTKEVQFASNNFYESYEKLHEQIKTGQINKVTVDMIGGTDCMKCHY